MKMRVRVGNIEVDYEGAEAFLEKKLPDLVIQLSKLESGSQNGRRDGGHLHVGSGDSTTLARFLQKHTTGKNQLRKFLATAEWLHIRGTETLKTGDVAKALQNSHQSKLANPSDCLNKNVSKGYCEKSGDGFFVTDDGRKELG